MSQPCALCGAAVADATVCSGDSRRLELALGDIPSLIEDLETVLAKITRYANQTQRVTGSKADDGIVPFNIPAGEARTILETVLRRWVMIVHEEHPQPRVLPRDRASASARYLIWYVEWMRHQKWAAEAIGSLIDAIHDVRRACDSPAGRRTDPLGPCPEHGCNGEVRAFIPRDDTTECHADCTADPEHTWDSTQFLRLGKRMLRQDVA